MLDLDAARAERLEAARAEYGAAVADFFPLRFRGRDICELPTELPLDVLEPLTDVAVDLGLIVRTALDAARSQDPNAATMAVIDMVVDQLIINQQLPEQLMTAAKEMAARLLGEDGYPAFLAARPSVFDVVALVKGLLRKYGLRLGESSPSSASSSGGTTSTPISPATTPDSTPAEPGDAPASPVSSESAGSSLGWSDSPQTL
ncbi:hypothetical protein [Planomonospora sp. ID82291]|uniref:hypothetical protein n=1 Tax=Planomonospora sp. ID82291 TaxID=2738136 RepID=UPI0018C41B2E|nr:hypothetical protein [Planomonospora sp. ID82291]MBG0819026.1 hypothetical protein [Planomonospora sp. ID82291]